MVANKVIIDSSALLAWLFKEPGYKTVAQILAHSIAPVSVITEVLYIAIGQGYRATSEQIFQDIVSMGVEIEPILVEDSIRAAELIAVSRAMKKGKKDPSLSLGDGLCIAVAERLELAITGDDVYWSHCDLKVKYLPFRG